MRKVGIKNRALFDADLGTDVVCWHDMEQVCGNDCAAFAEVVMARPDHTQEPVAVCIATPQMMPIGSLGAPSGLVTPPPRPLVGVR